MSSLKDKMYEHEITAPANAWEKIAAALDESEIENKFPLKLYDIEIIPPAGAWEKISNSLSEEQLQNEYPSRLYNMELTPPATAWQKIAAGLKTAPESVSAPVRKLFPFVRYAVAAIFIGAIAFGIIKLTVNTGNRENSAVSATTQKGAGIAGQTKPADTGTTQTTVINAIENEDEVFEKSKPIAVRHDKLPLKRVKRAITSSAITSRVDENVTDLSLFQTIYAYADHIPDIADRYVMLMTPDGNIIRMSKKWSDLLCCVSGEEENEDCKFQLKKWQEKIGSSSLAPSPGNFMDILGLVNSLNESNGL